jgi:hypothetical protein
MRVLVCGGRNYIDWANVHRVLSTLDPPPTLVMSGGARGVDSMALAWAKDRRIATLKFMADWDRYGLSAGPRRNQKMLDDGRPDMVIAFPGSVGTADMVRRARLAGIPIREETR